MNTTDAQPVNATAIAMPDEVGYLILRPSLLRICHNDHRAMCILAMMLHWHDWKLTKWWPDQKRVGLPTEKDLALYFSNRQIQEGILGMFNKDAVRDGVQALAELGFITITTNPCKKFSFDRKPYYIVHAGKINAALNSQTAPGRAAA